MSRLGHSLTFFGLAIDLPTKPKEKYAEQLSRVTGVKPLPVGLLLVTQFESGTQWRPPELSAGKGELALFENTVSVRRQPEKALCTVQEVMSQAQGLKGRRGEAKQMVNHILQILEPINPFV